MAQQIPQAFVPIDLSTLNSLVVTRYMTFSGIIILLWDLLLTFPEELRYVWKSRFTLPKAGYVSNRYLMCVFMLILINDVVAPTRLSDEWCGLSSAVLAVLIFLTDALGHILVIFRLFILWNRNRRILILLILGSVVVNSVALAFIGLTVSHIAKNPVFIDFLKACAVDVRPMYMIGIWAPQVFFDIYVLFLLCLNAMDRPRAPGQKLLKMLYEDGFLLIFVAFALRLTNLILCTLNSPSLSMLGISFVESFITTINGRLLLGVFKIEHPQSGHFEDDILCDENPCECKCETFGLTLIKSVSEQNDLKYAQF